MKVARTTEVARCAVQAWKKEGLHIALVPTMGFLHAGHESLIARAAKDNDRVAVSIFVNPLQFGPNEDLDRYPRNMESDLELCKNAGVDLVFTPEPEVMYPPGYQTRVCVWGLTERLCGASRPGHFDGVCTVVCKLFNIVTPDRAYFGQKDAQQLAVVRRMVRDLCLNVEVVGCPIVREADGLALSSRNIFLGPQERGAALALRRSLLMAERAVTEGARESDGVKTAMREILDAEPLLKLDYLDIVDPVSLEPLRRIAGQTLICLAAFIGSTRLIDNTLVKPSV